MSISGFLKGRWANFQQAQVRRQLLKTELGAPDIERSQWPHSLSDPTGFYLDCFRYFHQRLPKEITRHRRYFARRRRGFGEDAFHTMWFLLFREFRPASFLEIGVYRGQTLSLMALLAQRAQAKCHLCGISPFSQAGDAVSKYKEIPDYYQDTLRNFQVFALPHPQLVKAYSTDLEAAAVIQSRLWDIAYIDGNHDYEVARADWELCSVNIKVGGLVVLDDSAITSPYAPPIFATRGHPGPSRVAQEIPRDMFHEILQVGHNRVFQKVVST